MKINWGAKIAILYLSFVLMIGVLVYKSSQEKVDLVSADYYAQELKFQDKINAKNNANNLVLSIAHKLENNNVCLSYPEEIAKSNLTGEIYFFRPSNSEQDVRVKMEVDNTNKQIISSSHFQHGMYKMQLSWSVDGVNYFKEETIFIN